MRGSRAGIGATVAVLGLLLVGTSTSTPAPATGIATVELAPIVQGLDDGRLVLAVDMDGAVGLATGAALREEVAAPFDDVDADALVDRLRADPTGLRSLRLVVEADSRARASALAGRAADVLLQLREEQALQRLRRLGERIVTSLQQVQAEQQTLDDDDDRLRALQGREARLRELLERLRRRSVDAGTVRDVRTVGPAGVTGDDRSVDPAGVPDGNGGAAAPRPATRPARVVAVLALVTTLGLLLAGPGRRAGAGPVRGVRVDRAAGRPEGVRRRRVESRARPRGRTALLLVAAGAGLGGLSVVDAVAAALGAAALLVAVLVFARRG